MTHLIDTLFIHLSVLLLTLSEVSEELVECVPNESDSLWLFQPILELTFLLLHVEVSIIVKVLILITLTRPFLPQSSSDGSLIMHFRIIVHHHGLWHTTFPSSRSDALPLLFIQFAVDGSSCLWVQSSIVTFINATIFIIV